VKKTVHGLDRELPRRAGYLKDIVKGWRFLVRPGLAAGESAAWRASFWNFLQQRQQKCAAVFERVYKSYPERDAGVYAFAS
jgi:hypothetical protein